MKKYIIENKQFNGWEQISCLKDFSSPWCNSIIPGTSFQAYHDFKFLYFRFVAMGDHPLIYVKNNNKMEVTLSERVEIFFRKDSSMSPYYCLEIDPNGRVLDYQAFYYRNFYREWEWPEDLKIQGAISSNEYTVEGRLKLSTLSELGLLEGNIMQVGLFRGNCKRIIGEEALITWISWVNPNSEFPDFHISSSFGIFELEHFN